MTPVVISGPGEAGYCRSIAEAADLPGEQLQVFDDLGNMAAFLQRSALFIGNDGGPKHLAVAMKTPTVTLFRNDPPEYWTPPSDLNHVAIISQTGESSEGDVPAVMQAVNQILNCLRHE
jgi:ADP-heptose:LPS heptosyltransferase